MYYDFNPRKTQKQIKSEDTKDCKWCNKLSELKKKRKKCYYHRTGKTR